KPTLEACVTRILHHCHTESEKDAQAERALLASTLHDSLHTRLDAMLAAADPTLCLENGCTLCLAVVYLDRVFCAGIGDSSMICLSPADGDGQREVLRIWQRMGSDDPPAGVCSFEDTLASWPVQLRQGQNVMSVAADYQHVRQYTRKSHVLTQQGMVPVYKIASSRSLYGLGMTNTVGNMNHKGNLVGTRGMGRTSVYVFSEDDVPSDSLFVFCSDGVKDVLQAEDIARIVSDPDSGIRALSPDHAYTPDIQAVLHAMHPGIDAHASRSREHILEILMRREEAAHELDDLAAVITHVAVLRYSADDVSALLAPVGWRPAPLLRGDPMQVLAPAAGPVSPETGRGDCTDTECSGMMDPGDEYARTVVAEEGQAASTASLRSEMGDAPDGESIGLHQAVQLLMYRDARKRLVLKLAQAVVAAAADRSKRKNEGGGGVDEVEACKRNRVL
ncbi:MAG: hypothetical protein SGCHY_004193, partial [Lobulomycetales sp.]